MKPIRLIALICALLAFPAIAAADGKDVIRDCARDGDLDRDYSDKELKEASENLPSDIDQYSNCRQVIRQAQTGGRGGSDSGGSSGGAGGAGGGGSGGSASGYGGSGAGAGGAGSGATGSDRAEIDRRSDEARNGIAPTGAGQAASVRDDDSGLPTAALVAILLLALGAIAGGAYLLRDRLPPGVASRLPGASR